MKELRAENISFAYPHGKRKTEVFQGADVTLQQGHLYVVTGEPRCGKTTLLQILGGMIKPDQGMLKLDGTALKWLRMHRYQRDTAAMIQQQDTLIASMTVVENIAVPLRLRGFRGRLALEEALVYLRQVHLPVEYADVHLSQLSGGERQRVAIARALAAGAQILLADEPTRNLDAESSAEIVYLLAEFSRREGCCVVAVTHDNALALCADKKIEIRDGKIYQ